MPLPWRDVLIKIGFFKELDHFDVNDFSLEEVVSDTPQADEEKLVSYLESGVRYRASEQLVEDVLGDGSVEIGPAHLLTDGVYVWPADLPYYVRKYHARLLTSFSLHAKRNGWRVPTDVEITSKTFVD